MKLKHNKTLIAAQGYGAKIFSISCSSNNKKVAICTHDRIVTLFDEYGERKSRFALKCADPKNSSKSFEVKGMAFSQDGTKLAVSQSDGIVYVYKLGEDWDAKKVICNKFPQKCASTCIIWPSEQPIICGLSDGKVRSANPITNKSSTIYNAESHVIALAADVDGNGFISGHVDGKIIRYYFDNEKYNDSQGKFAVHPTPPYALVWAGSSILAGGSDRRVYVYNKEGRVIQQFDYSKSENEKEFFVASCNKIGQIVAFGSFNRIRTFSWSPRKSGWEESKITDIENILTITALCWNQDGSKLIVGSSCGSVDIFDCSMKKKVYTGMYEFNYVGLSQVVIKNMNTKETFLLQSKSGYEIEDVRLMEDNNHLVAYTSNTIIIADFKENKLSEIIWTKKHKNEKFYFDYKSFCIIFCSGEISVIEYGLNEVLSSVRSEFASPYLISVRVNDRDLGRRGISKRMAYMLDMKTITVLDLVNGNVVASVTHEKAIDWIELNETGEKLLFRDKKLQLLLFNIEKDVKSILLSYCSYVQWVPNSDVIVAQSEDLIYIWYNVDSNDKASTINLKYGEVVDILRNNGKTEVMVKEGTNYISYPLDDKLIEFATAMNDKNLNRAAVFLESVDFTPETKSMWEKLGRNSLNSGNLLIAEQCYAMLGYISKARYLQNIRMLKQSEKISQFQIDAKLEILNKNFKLAEDIYLKQNAISDVISMYTNLYKWEDAIEIAEAKNWSHLEQLRTEYQNWLKNTDQDEKAAEFRIKSGDSKSAILFYLQAGLPGKAAALLLSDTELMQDRGLVDKIIRELKESELYEKAGELFEFMSKPDEALSLYRQAKSYQKAVDLARISFPNEVIKLEDEWGDYLVKEQQLDMAINHFIESGSYIKAVDAAINSNQWNKANHILDAIEDTKSPDLLAPYFTRLGNHYANSLKFDLAEKVFIKANESKLAIDMYNSHGIWEKAYHIASTITNNNKLTDVYSTQATELEKAGNFEEAERLYLIIREIDKAIAMYKNSKKYRDVIRLVKLYRSDLLNETYISLANQLQSEENLKQAEQYYVEGKDWKSAINMYCDRNRWEDAYRVASNCNEQLELRKQIAFLWSKYLGGESAIRLLTRLGLLEQSIDRALSMNEFQFAFDLANLACQERLPELHYKYAMSLEDEGKFVEAEEQFIKANKQKEAVLMYIHIQDWESAVRVATTHDPDSLNDVLLGQARFAFGNKEFSKAEALLLRAQRPDMVIKIYREAEMLEEALRVAEIYLPDSVKELKEEIINSSSMLENSFSSYATLANSTAQTKSQLAMIKDKNVTKARKYESDSDYLKAIESYLKFVPDPNKSSELINHDLYEHVWLHASNLAIKFLQLETSTKIVGSITTLLISIKRHVLAGELFLSINQVEKAVDSFILGEAWTKAKHVARELQPKLESYIEKKYKESQKLSKKVDIMADSNQLSTLDMYAEQGEWTKCLELAEKLSQSTMTKCEKDAGKKMNSQNPLLHKYVAAYAASLIKKSLIQDALALYEKYGTPAFEQNFNIYKRIFQELTNKRTMSQVGSYTIWSMLRNMLFELCQNLDHSTDIHQDVKSLFEKMLLISHYYSTCSALMSCEDENDVKEMITEIYVSLLRYSDLLPADKVFYEAGVRCREIGWYNMAFVFLNRYLDLVEAIEDPDNLGPALDGVDFQFTDIPVEVPIPEKAYTTVEEHEAVRGWVLAVSMDQKLDQTLPKDERGIYVASLTAHNTGLISQPCIITGYPVLRNGVRFSKSKQTTIRNRWDKFCRIAKIHKSKECAEVKRFIESWCGSEMEN